MNGFEIICSVAGVLYLMFGGIVADEVVRLKDYQGKWGMVGVVVFVVVFWSVLLVWAKIKLNK